MFVSLVNFNVYNNTPTIVPIPSARMMYDPALPREIQSMFATELKKPYPSMWGYTPPLKKFRLSASFNEDYSYMFPKIEHWYSSDPDKRQNTTMSPLPLDDTFYDEYLKAYPDEGIFDDLVAAGYKPSFDEWTDDAPLAAVLMKNDGKYVCKKAELTGNTFITYTSHNDVFTGYNMPARVYDPIACERYTQPYNPDGGSGGYKWGWDQNHPETDPCIHLKSFAD